MGSKSAISQARFEFQHSVNCDRDSEGMSQNSPSTRTAESDSSLIPEIFGFSFSTLIFFQYVTDATRRLSAKITTTLENKLDVDAPLSMRQELAEKKDAQKHRLPSSAPQSPHPVSSTQEKPALVRNTPNADRLFVLFPNGPGSKTSGSPH